MKSVVVLSGGMDSATALYKVINDAASSNPDDTHAVSSTMRSDMSKSSRLPPDSARHSASDTPSSISAYRSHPH